MWQYTDLELIPGADPERAPIPFNLPDAFISDTINKPINSILDDLYKNQINDLLNTKGDDESSSSIPDIICLIEPGIITVPIVEEPNGVKLTISETDRVYTLSTNIVELPDNDKCIKLLAGDKYSWLYALLTTPHILENNTLVPNAVQRVLHPRTGHIAKVSLKNNIPHSVRIFDNSQRQVITIFTNDQFNICIAIHHYIMDKSIEWNQKFRFHPQHPWIPIHKDIEGQDECDLLFMAEAQRIGRSSYNNTLLSAGTNQPGELHQELIIELENVIDYCNIAGNDYTTYQDIFCKGRILVPFDYMFLIAWPAIFSCLMQKPSCGGIMNMVHKSNSFRLFDPGNPLYIGDTVTISAKTTQVINGPAGKQVTVNAIISRGGNNIAEVVAILVMKNSFVDTNNMYSIVIEEPMQLNLKTENDICILESKEWFIPIPGFQNNLKEGDILEFALESDYHHASQTMYSSIKTSGKVMFLRPVGDPMHIADVDFESGRSYANSVIDYLKHHGKPTREIMPLKSGECALYLGDPNEYETEIYAPEDNWSYAYISGDYNPIHTNTYIADYLGLPTSITFGMWTSAATRTYLETYVAAGHPSRVKSYRVEFINMFLPGDKLGVNIYHIGMRDGYMVIRGETINQNGEKVLECIAEVEQPPSAYIFTGQGSQEVGMGMELYKSSRVARDIWDRGDAYMLNNYGISILAIVRDNPVSLTVYFGGEEGESLRKNYEVLSYEYANTCGEISTVPMFLDIANGVDSYTFSSPNGLLVSSQFAQPAMSLLSLASVADMRASGIIQKHAPFAGHSIGEQIALASIAETVSLEDMLDIAFFRGTLLHQSATRDKNNYSLFGMVAVNPSRISPQLSEKTLFEIIKAIRSKSDELLVVINYNIQGQQYIVSGVVRLLDALGSVLNVIVSTKYTIHYPVDLNKIVACALSKADKKIAKYGYTTLSSGVCTVPIAGVDVPSHSSFLLPKVEPFRRFMQKKFDEEAIDFSRLHKHYIPNMTAMPFDVSKEYFEYVYRLTESPILEDELNRWIDRNDNFGNVSRTRKLARTLLVELLSYHIACPVQWIETQSIMFDQLGVERFIEIGPSSTLSDMARRSVKSGIVSRNDIAILSVSQNNDEIYRLTSLSLSPQNPRREICSLLHSTPIAPISLVTESNDLQIMENNSPIPIEKAIPAIIAQEPKLPQPTSITDEPLSVVDILRIIITQKLKRTIGNISAGSTIKALVNGKSTIQNEIVGDLQKEFANSVPDIPEEIPLCVLAERIVQPDGAIGAYSSEQINRIFRSKLPGGFSISIARNYLDNTFGFGLQRQDAALLIAVVMEPISLLESDDNASLWMDDVVQEYGKMTGIIFQKISSGTGNVSPTNNSMSVVDTKILEQTQTSQKILAKKQLDALAKYLDIDLREDERLAEELENKNRLIQRDFDSLIDEFGDEFVRNIGSHFDPLKARLYDSYWNWGRQDAFILISDIVAKKVVEGSHEYKSRVIGLANRSTPGLIQLLNYSAENLKNPKYRNTVRRIYNICNESLNRHPVYIGDFISTRPCTTITENGHVTYSEVPQEDFSTPLDYIRRIKEEWCDGWPVVYIEHNSSTIEWTYSSSATDSYFNALTNACTIGQTFANKCALVTGCGRGSIGIEIVKGLLRGGAKVIATTLSYSYMTVQWYMKMYQRSGSRGLSLVVASFNQASVKDIKNLIQYIYNDKASGKGLGMDLDFVVPFGAIPGQLGDISDVGPREELSLRAMLTNIHRLLGEIIREKSERHYVSHPTQVIVPLSGNQGVFGNDGLYSESKSALMTLFTRWHSESWRRYLALAGAQIGWTRGTGLMNLVNLRSEEMEKIGLCTFSREEMAFNILGLMSPSICSIAQKGPIIGMLSGRENKIPGFWNELNRISNEISRESSIKRAVYQDAVIEYTNRTCSDPNPHVSSNKKEPRANFKTYFPEKKSYKQLEHLRHLEGMVNLDKVVVVTGYGEVGTFGSAETRWEMEAYGEFSLEGCVELAWIMGYIKYFDGILESSGDHYAGWIDTKTNDPVHDNHVKMRYEQMILENTGIRLADPDFFDDGDSTKRTILRELQITHDIDPFEASAEEAAQFKLQNGDKVDIWKNSDESWSARYLKGAVLMVPKALNINYPVIANVPHGWDPVRYGIDEELSKSIDPATLYTLVAVVEALMRTGIADPYELYKYFHVSEVGNSIGSGSGGQRSVRRMVESQVIDRPYQVDIMQEVLINTTAAWVNMLFLSSTGPIRPPVGACATSILSVDIAADAIRSGKAKVMIAGGCESVDESALVEFSRIKATVDSTSDTACGRIPKELSRSCTTTRGGFVESVGAAVVTLMSASAALEFGAPIYGIIAATNTAADKIGRSVPAPDQGIITSATEIYDQVLSQPLDIEYRCQQLKKRQSEIDSWMSTELNKIEQISEKNIISISREEINHQAMVMRKEAQSIWGMDFWKNTPHISQLRGNLAIWGLAIDDIGVASFHGTGTPSNDKNESEVFNTQFKHLRRSPGNPVPVVCQKSIIGHEKGASGVCELNGLIQIMRTGFIPGNFNLDNVDNEFKNYDNLLYLSRSVKTPFIKAGIMKSFGFGQVGGEILVVHPEYLLTALTCEQLEQYQTKLPQREANAYRYWNDTLVGNHSFVQIKDAPPYKEEQEIEVLLDPLARARYDADTNRYIF